MSPLRIECTQLHNVECDMDRNLRMLVELKPHQAESMLYDLIKLIGEDRARMVLASDFSWVEWTEDVA